MHVWSRRLICAADALLPLSALALAPARRQRAIYLAGGSIASRRAFLDAFLDGLAQLGHRRGETFDFDAIE